MNEQPRTPRATKRRVAAPRGTINLVELIGELEGLVVGIAAGEDPEIDAPALYVAAPPGTKPKRLVDAVEHCLGRPPLDEVDVDKDGVSVTVPEPISAGAVLAGAATVVRREAELPRGWRIMSALDGHDVDIAVYPSEWGPADDANEVAYMLSLVGLGPARGGPTVGGRPTFIIETSLPGDVAWWAD